jgi:hypothetical protein
MEYVDGSRSKRSQSLFVDPPLNTEKSRRLSRVKDTLSRWVSPRAKWLTKITRKKRKKMKPKNKEGRTKIAKVECRREGEEEREEEKGDLHSHGLCPYPTSSPEYVEPPDIPGGD